jgi:hypothetical protein
MVREIRCCMIRLLRAYNKEASESGGTGISGRIAKAAVLAFNRIFGSEEEKIKDKKEKAKEESSSRKIPTTKRNTRKLQLNEPTNLLLVLIFRVVVTSSHAKPFH